MKLIDIPNPFGGPVYHFDVVDSTMDEAATLSDAGAPHGTVVIADFQRTGRGRIDGRRWMSASGENLLMTVILDSKIYGDPVRTCYPLITGLAVCMSLEDIIASGIRIKWPNDILIDGKKCAGILCRTHGSSIHIGAGINCLQKCFDGEYSYPPTSLTLEAGRSIAPADILPGVLQRLRVLLEGKLDTKAFEPRLYGYGSPCRALSGLPDSGTKVEGILYGIDETGALLLKIPGSGGIERLVSGEVCLVSEQ